MNEFPPAKGDRCRNRTNRKNKNKKSSRCTYDDDLSCSQKQRNATAVCFCGSPYYNSTHADFKWHSREALQVAARHVAGVFERSKHHQARYTPISCSTAILQQALLILPGIDYTTINNPNMIVLLQYKSHTSWFT